MKNLFILLFFISSTHIFSNSNLATKDDIKMLKDDIKMLINQMDKRFEDTNKRLDVMQHNIDKRFEDMNKRFEDMNKRFEDMNKRFDDMKTMYLFSVSVIAAVLGALLLQVRDLYKSVSKLDQIVDAINKNEGEKLLRFLQNANYETKQKIKKELNEILEIS